MATIKEKAFEIIGIFEEFLVDRKVEIFNEERDENDGEQATIFGSDYDSLERDLLTTLRSKKFFIYKLYDEDYDFGRFKTDCELVEFEKILEEYKSNNEEEYHIDDFIQHMRKKGYSINRISLDGEVFF